MRASRADPDPLSLSVSTPERVALALPIAGIGSRTAAYLLDVGLLALMWAAAYFALSFFANAVDLIRELSWVVQTLLVVAIFATQWVYWTACEVIFDGRTLGKRIAGIRVVRLDGGRVGFFNSAVRNLLRVVDFLPGFYGFGVLTMLVNRQHRRLGDLAAGTVLVREERIDLDRYEVAPGGDAAGAPARISSGDAELVVSFLARAEGLEPEARRRIGLGLVKRLAPEMGEAEALELVGEWPKFEAFLRGRVR